jgi:hypothetical protein
MMKTLQTVRLKPNPAGKDRSRSGQATAAQLGAEWVDIRNTGRVAVPMSGVRVYHIAYPADKTKPRTWELVIAFGAWDLGPGQVVRVHSGEKRALSVLNEADRQGADWHAFTGRDRYIWNNAEGDTSRITEMVTGSEQETDKASYDPNPPEGVVLVRSGNKLIPGGVGTYASAFAAR